MDNSGEGRLHRELLLLSTGKQMVKDLTFQPYQVLRLEMTCRLVVSVCMSCHAMPAFFVSDRWRQTNIAVTGSGPTNSSNPNRSNFVVSPTMGPFRFH
mmetsp:Transcript_18010/g.51142  ORF Transcript_18010/g.51142 Transcript_18010/m.51142 type:complete len:98 (+) Transcript_18010:189-482(+)